MKTVVIKPKFSIGQIVEYESHTDHKYYGKILAAVGTVEYFITGITLTTKYNVSGTYRDENDIIRVVEDVK